MQNSQLWLMNKKFHIGVIGAGSWGTTLAWLLAEKGNEVRLWDIDRESLKYIAENRTHKRLPGLRLPESVRISYELPETVKDSKYVVIVVPSRSFRECCINLKQTGHLTPEQLIIICTKGLEPETGLTMSAVARDVVGEEYKNSICVLSGPSHAEEVARKMPTVVVVAGYNEDTSRRVQGLFMTPFFRLYSQSDILGVELGGALKNVIAIAAGICDGLGYGDNTKAALLTRGLAEMIRLSVAMGARIETFTGLSGIGDLIVTATSRHSRNRNFGEALAQGLSIQEAQEKIGMVVEGITTVISVVQLAKKFNVEMPISTGVYEVLYKGKSPKEVAQELMLRDPKPEIYGI